jgi:hypothetical protein
MNRTPVSSSYAASVGYDANTTTLEVEHHDGSVYQYFDIPETVYRELMQASSFGAFMHTEIRDQYRYTKV